MSAKQEFLTVVLLLVIFLAVFGQEIIEEVEEWEDVTPLPIPSQPNQPGQGNMATSPEFNNVKSLWTGLANFKPATKEELDDKRKTCQSQLDNHIKAMEAKSLSGRWVRKFLESELDSLFNELNARGKFGKEKSPSEEERITGFWKGLDFCYEGLKTLDSFKEYDGWLSDLLENRYCRSLRSVKDVSFKKRIAQLKLTTEQYKANLIKLLDSAYDYKQKIKPNALPVVIGKTKDELTDVMVRTPNGNWNDHNSRKDKEFFQTDLIEVKAKEDKKVILSDRRYITLEAEAIISGWELIPQIPEDLFKEISRLIELLNNDDWQTREKATEELTAIGEPTITPLKEALKHPEPEVRMRAAMILKKIDRGDIDKQVRALTDPYVNKGQYPPYNQLMQLGDKNEIIKVLQTMLQESQRNKQSLSMLKWMISMIQQGANWEQPQHRWR